MQMYSGKSAISGIWRFYLDGFKDLPNWGRKVWIVIIIKLFIIFAVIRLLFMPDVLKKNFKTDEQRSEHVLENLINPSR